MIFWLLSSTIAEEVLCKLHLPVPGRYWLPGEHRKSYCQEKCLTNRESGGCIDFTKNSIHKPSYFLMRITYFWEWGFGLSSDIVTFPCEDSAPPRECQTQWNTGSSAFNCSRYFKRKHSVELQKGSLNNFNQFLFLQIIFN